MSELTVDINPLMLGKYLNSSPRTFARTFCLEHFVLSRVVTGYHG
jgi:hypothetical protein